MTRARATAAAIMAAAGALLVAGCAAANAPAGSGSAFTDVYVADFRSDQPAAACRPSDVPQNHGQAREFFSRARQVDYKTLHDHYEQAPCFAEGTLKRAGKSCDFQIRAGGTGAVQCGEQKLYFACDTCGDLLGTK